MMSESFPVLATWKHSFCCGRKYRLQLQAKIHLEDLGLGLS
jgi:hypothetical protein